MVWAGRGGGLDKFIIETEGTYLYQMPFHQ